MLVFVQVDLQGCNTLLNESLDMGIILQTLTKVFCRFFERKYVSWCTLLFVLSQPLLAQHPNHHYPLIGWQTFAGAIPDYYARFDLLVSRHANTDFALAVKRINPNILMVSTMDWNAAEDFRDSLPDEWWLRDSNGNYLHSYGNWKMANLSDLCPVASNGQFAGKRYVEFVAEWMVNRIDLSVWDGVGTNGVWGRDGMKWKYGKAGWDNIDIDNNGINDLSEHSKDWFLNHWQGGIDILLTNLRHKLGHDKLIIINSGTRHTWGWGLMNGVVDEKLPYYNNETFDSAYYKDFNAAAYKPAVSVADGRPWADNPSLPAESKNDFVGMRFGLVTSMFNDVYFSFQSLEANEHYWSSWYDEFDLDLGKPTGPPKEVRFGLWIRFFDNGVAIASTDGNPQTVSDSDLQSFSEYVGPYYRFIGGQNPEFNNGRRFDTITLTGIRVGDAPRYIVGDGIILLKQPLPVISDIIIDNVDMGTSPSNVPVSLTNSFHQEEDCNAGSGFYSVRCAWNPGTFPYAIATLNSGEATFRPNIGVSGYYEVFEWHGIRKAGPLASNVKHIVRHSGGETIRFVDQNVNVGQWNSLGIFYFNKGTTGSVIISSTGSNGVVMADAIKFTFKGVELTSDTKSPNPPQNIKVE